MTYLNTQSYELSTLDGTCRCTPKQEVDLEVTASTPDKATWEGRVVYVTGVSKPQLVVKSTFAEIANCQVNSITVTGDLYLHDCPSEIESITATGDVILYRWNQVRTITTQGDVYLIIHDNGGKKVFNWIGAKDIHQIFLTKRTDLTLDMQKSDTNSVETRIKRV